MSSILIERRDREKYRSFGILMQIQLSIAIICSICQMFIFIWILSLILNWFFSKMVQMKWTPTKWNEMKWNEKITTTKDHSVELLVFISYNALVKCIHCSMYLKFTPNDVSLTVSFRIFSSPSTFFTFSILIFLLRFNILVIWKWFDFRCHLFVDRMPFVPILSMGFTRQSTIDLFFWQSADENVNCFYKEKRSRILIVLQMLRSFALRMTLAKYKFVFIFNRCILSYPKLMVRWVKIGKKNHFSYSCFYLFEKSHRYV